MILKNLTRKTVITNDFKITLSLVNRLIGLLDKQNPRSLLFYTRFGIHTFFIKSPIDVLVLNSNDVVIKLNTVKPNRLFLYDPKYTTVIELPEGSIKKSRTHIGDKLIISD